MNRLMTALVFCTLVLTTTHETDAASKKLTVKSGAFTNNKKIPSLYTCDDSGVSPALSWSKTPKKTKSIAIIVSDPDAPDGAFYHWGIYNLPPSTKSFAKGAKAPKGAVQTTNDFGDKGYAGPCPPEGETHRYIFKVFALNTKLKATKKNYNLNSAGTLAYELENIKGSYRKNVIASGTLTGTYKVTGSGDSGDGGDDGGSYCDPSWSAEKCSCLDSGKCWTVVNGGPGQCVDIALCQ